VTFCIPHCSGIGRLSSERVTSIKNFELIGVTLNLLLVILIIELDLGILCRLSEVKKVGIKLFIATGSALPIAAMKHLMNKITATSYPLLAGLAKITQQTNAVFTYNCSFQT
jgi:hypothetical protein